MSLNKYQEKAESTFQRIDRYLFGIPSVIRRAGETFSHAFGAEAAGSVAYYALFSIFPLLLLLTSFASLWVRSANAVDQVIGFAGEIFKIPTDQLKEALNQIVSASGISGIIGLLALIWSATGVFTSLARNISRAWPHANLLTAFQGRLMAVAMLALIAVSQFLWVFLTTAISLIARIELPFGQGDYSYLRNWLSNLTINGLSFALFYLGFFVLYRLVPKTRVRWAEAFWGANFATLATFIASRAYIWYLNSGFANYEVIYGSIGTTLGLVVFFYINAWIVLFGAHLSSAVGYQYRLKHPNQSTPNSKRSRPAAADGTEPLSD